MLNNQSVPGKSGIFHVAELAKRADVTPATVRYYSRIGLLEPGREEENGYRCYSMEDLHRLVFVRQAQTLGLTIGDIKSILKSLSDGDVPCQQVKSLAGQRLIGIQDQISDLRATEMRMIQAIKYWEELDGPTPLDGELCPLIERFDAVSTL